MPAPLPGCRRSNPSAPHCRYYAAIPHPGRGPLEGRSRLGPSTRHAGPGSAQGCFSSRKPGRGLRSRGRKRYPWMTLLFCLVGLNRRSEKVPQVPGKNPEHLVPPPCLPLPPCLARGLPRWPWLGVLRPPPVPTAGPRGRPQGTHRCSASARRRQTRPRGRGIRRTRPAGGGEASTAGGRLCRRAVSPRLWVQRGGERRRAARDSMCFAVKTFPGNTPARSAGGLGWCRLARGALHRLTAVIPETAVASKSSCICAGCVARGGLPHFSVPALPHLEPALGPATGRVQA